MTDRSEIVGMTIKKLDNGYTVTARTRDERQVAFNRVAGTLGELCDIVREAFPEKGA